MIFDTLYHCEQYYPIHPGVRKAFEFLKEKGKEIECGTYLIDGESVRATVCEKELHNKNSVFLESHDRHIDIQLVLTGEETYGFRNRNYCHIRQGEYNSDTDTQFWDDTPQNYLHLQANDFCIIFPQDCHVPLIGHGLVKKVVVKVKV